jgi:hypothetical protein
VLAGPTRPTIAAINVIIWVETPQSVRESRDAVRIAAGEISAASYAGWMAEENAYMTAEQPWRQADLIVDGSGILDRDHETEVSFRVGDQFWRLRHVPSA